MQSDSNSSAWMQTLVGAVLGILATVLATWWANSTARRIAAQSGAFAKPVVSVNLLGEALTPAGTKFRIRHPGAGGNVLVPLTIQIQNSGDRSVEDAVLVVQASKFAIPPADGGLTHSVTPGVFKSDVQREVSELGNFRQVSIRVPPIHPQTQLTVSEPLVMSPTRLEKPVSARTKDGVDVTFNVRVDYAYHVGVTLLLKDSVPIQGSAEIGCFVGPSLDALVTEATQERNKKISDQLSKLPWWRRVALRVAPKETTIVHFLDIEVERVHQQSGSTLYELKQGIEGIKEGQEWRATAPRELLH